ncbi:NAD(P)/FAD-dependent oxidoreductase [Marinilactibacillus kalidii]|uniref:NAD(P)/FAD-dependent oxidoreductase n=1 Tax=Marinilactibacillus kalidii TaxID=2820274 RepID=UPI001ABE68B6|nr:NAD(P)/FAD-dependent oxidoreductase [Marinilactibacillus kalidii]
MIDVVIIGGGPAGMAAALVAGRGKKEVVLIDEEKPRNKVTKASHAFLTRDGVTPEQFREKGRRDLARYTGITTMNDKVVSVKQEDDYTFEVETLGAKKIYARKVVITTGFKETLPTIEGIENYYGQSLFSCPFCDGWEMKDESLVFIIDTKEGTHIPALLKNWADDLVVVTDGKKIFTDEQKKELMINGIKLIEKGIAKLEGEKGQLKQVIFEDGEKLNRTGGFCTPTIDQTFPLIQQLGIETGDNGFVKTDGMGRTNVAGIYAAGEITGPSQLIVSASQGHMVGVGMIFDDSAANFRNV